MQIKKLKQKLFITALVLAYTIILYYSHISCIIYRLTGIRCLGCGMTRALLSALRMDFSRAFSYHFMFWAVPMLYICFLLDGRLFRRKLYNVLLYILIFMGFVANWILHMQQNNVI